MKARPYQRKADADIVAAWKQHRRVLYTGPTGSGKTEQAVLVIKRAIASGKRVLFVSHLRTIVHQTADRLRRHGIRRRDLGVIMGDDDRLNPDALVQVASIQTLSRRSLPKADIVIVDEAHRAGSDQYTDLLAAYSKARILGLSATPRRETGAGLADVFDVLVLGPTPADLIADGYLARAKVYTAPDHLLPQLSKVRTVAGDYNQRELGEAVNQRILVGSIVDEWKRLADNRRTVVFAVDLDHARTIVDRFKAAKVRVEMLDGSTPQADRDAILARLKGGPSVVGGLAVVVNVGVLCEGWDMPEVKCVAVARPTRSITRWLQMTGRALRPCGQEPIVLDHSGTALFFGPPDWPQPWALEARRDGGCRAVVQRFQRGEAGELVEMADALVEAMPVDSACVTCGQRLGALPATAIARSKRGRPGRCRSCVAGGTPEMRRRVAAVRCATCDGAVAEQTARNAVRSGHPVSCMGCRRAAFVARATCTSCGARGRSVRRSGLCHKCSCAARTKARPTHHCAECAAELSTQVGATKVRLRNKPPFFCSRWCRHQHAQAAA
jgi:superfamily II DNA or RNA helicase